MRCGGLKMNISKDRIETLFIRKLRVATKRLCEWFVITIKDDKLSEKLKKL